jgi:Zn-dependent protease
MSDDSFTEFEEIQTTIKPKRHNEIKDIVIAWLGISLCFALVLGGYNLLRFKNFSNFSLTTLIMFLIVSLVVTGTAFILHELAHKYSAIYFGAKAQFVKWNMPLLFAIVLAFIVGFVFVAPGAVYVYGRRLTRKENGIVSVSGPVTNIILAGMFFALLNLINTNSNLVLMILGLGILINLWIAFFNLLPIGPLDGKAIFLWNPFVWIILMIISFGGYLSLSGILSSIL